jgi:branched-chain amino acid transport system substrate-binding protein
MNKHVHAILAIFVILSMLLAACAPAAPEPTPAPADTPAPPPDDGPDALPVGPVRMGGLIPLTGALSEFGSSFRLAGDLVVEQFAAVGYTIDIRYADTETSAIPGVEAARSLVEVDRVQVLIGAAASGVSIPIATSVSIPNQIPQISNASTSPLISYLPEDEGQDFLFRTCPSDALQGVVLGQLAYDEGYRRAAVFWVNNPYGEGLTVEFQRSFEGLGGELVASVPHDEAPAPTYVSELRRIMDANPDVVVALGYPGQATVYLKEFFEARYNETADLLFVDGTKSVEMPAELGAENLAGYFGTAPGTVEGVSLVNFERDYEAKYGSLPPLPFMSNFYDAVAVAALAAAACEARGQEATPICIRDNLRFVANPPGEAINAGVEGFQRALELLAAGQDINYEGAAGSVDFDENGDVVTPIEVWRYTEQAPYIESVRMETP